jgi:hypothetical protein
LREFRLLVCGGRDFDDVPWLWNVLDEINQRRIAQHGDGISCIIDGGQVKKRDDGALVGADYWAHQWALAHDVPSERFFADWNGLGRSAGPVRNRRMLAEGRPTGGLAMPGGNGTAHMVSLLREARIPVRVLRRGEAA